MEEPSAPRITAFDFDGTLTWRDSFTAFLEAECGWPTIARTFLSHPSLTLDYLRTRDRGALKSRLIHFLLGPIARADLEARMDRFVARTGMRLFRPDALEAWQSHTDIKRVIVTASPDLLVARFGAVIGADLVIGTRLGFGPDGRLLPELDGINCRGAEKVRRIREAFGDVTIVAAYGDTAGDTEMLAVAETGHYRVFHGKP